MLWVETLEWLRLSGLSLFDLASLCHGVTPVVALFYGYPAT
jgi:hypothetical protein